MKLFSFPSQEARLLAGQRTDFDPMAGGVCNMPVKKERDHRSIAQLRMITMTDTIYCYHCRRHHPADEVRLIQTKSGKRWRCVQSIRSCRGSSVRRDAFGKSVSEFNQAINEWKAVQLLPHCVREVFAGKPA